MANTGTAENHQIQTVQRPNGRWSFVIVQAGKTVTAGGSYSTEQDAASYGAKRSHEISTVAEAP